MVIIRALRVRMDFTVKSRVNLLLDNCQNPIVWHMNVWSSANWRLILDYHLKYAGIYLHVTPTSTPTASTHLPTTSSHPAGLFTAAHKDLRGLFGKVKTLGPCAVATCIQEDREADRRQEGEYSKGRTSHHSESDYIKDWTGKQNAAHITRFHHRT